MNPNIKYVIFFLLIFFTLDGIRIVQAAHTPSIDATFADAAFADATSARVPSVAQGRSLHEIISHDGGVASIRAALEHGANIHERDAKGRTPLYAAITFHDLPVIYFLLAKGAKVNIKDIDNVTPLHVAALSGNLVTVQTLLEEHADLHARDSYGDMPLHIVARRKNSGDIMLEFIKNKANVDAKTFNKRTPLHLAIMHKNVHGALMLLRNGADVYAKDIDGNTALHFAVLHQDIASVRELIDKSARLNVKNLAGQTPKDLAILYANSEVYNALVKAGALCSDQMVPGDEVLDNAVGYVDSDEDTLSTTAEPSTSPTSTESTHDFDKVTHQTIPMVSSLGTSRESTLDSKSGIKPSTKTVFSTKALTSKVENNTNVSRVARGQTIKENVHAADKKPLSSRFPFAKLSPRAKSPLAKLSLVKPASVKPASVKPVSVLSDDNGKTFVQQVAWQK